MYLDPITVPPLLDPFNILPTSLRNLHSALKCCVLKFSPFVLGEVLNARMEALPFQEVLEDNHDFSFIP